VEKRSAKDWQTARGMRWEMPMGWKKVWPEEKKCLLHWLRVWGWEKKMGWEMKDPRGLG
jgi:hypothetical protein